MAFSLSIARVLIAGCSSRSLALLLQVKALDNFLAVIFELPLFGVVIGIDKGEDYASHVSGVLARKIGGVHKVKRHRLVVARGRCLHAWLVPRGAVVCKQQSSADK